MASSYRLRRGPAIVVLLLVGLVGAVVLGRRSLAPSLDVYAPVALPDAYAGTTYAFDGLVCVSASSVGARVASVRAGGDTRVGLRPAGAPLAVAYPVPADALAPAQDAQVAAGDQRCLRLLVTPDAQGQVRAGTVRVSMRYGPLGLLRRTLSTDAPAVLQVTGTGPDPRAAA